MKKIALFLAVMTAVLVSCAKNEDAAVPESPQAFTVSVNVSDPVWDQATKAFVKTGWVEDDVISIWLDGSTSANPNIVIKYNGDEWVTDESAAVEPFTPVEGGYTKAVYNGNVVVASKDFYVILGQTIFVRLENWAFLSGLQVVLTGLNPEDAALYSLGCSRFTTIGTGKYAVEADTVVAAAGPKGAEATGIANADGVAFVFAASDAYGQQADYTFYLIDRTSGTPVCSQYIAPAKTLVANTARMKGIKIAASSFADVVDLSADATANTYIVSAAGKYCFNATVKGNGRLDPVTGTTATPLTGICGVRVLWEINAQGNAVKYEGNRYSINYSDGYVFFDTPATFAAGAAYVGVFDANGNILWSWLIWATDAPQTLNYSNGGRSWKYMDRNLGALATGGRGFMYQWGRKDPFPTYGSTTFYPAMGTAFSHVHVDDIESTTAYATAHPATFIETSDGGSFNDKHNWLEENCNTLWDREKTIYDPSPAGWVIPSYQDIVRTDNADYTYFHNCFTSAGFGRWTMTSSAFNYGNAPSTGYCWTSTSRPDYPQSAYYIRSNGQLTYVNAKADGYVVRCIGDPDSSDGNAGAQPYDINPSDLGDGDWSNN